MTLPPAKIRLNRLLIIDLFGTHITIPIFSAGYSCHAINSKAIAAAFCKKKISLKKHFIFSIISFARVGEMLTLPFSTLERYDSVFLTAFARLLVVYPASILFFLNDSLSAKIFTRDSLNITAVIYINKYITTVNCLLNILKISLNSLIR